MTYEGGCRCGAVRYRMTSAPMFVHCCHCLDCQKETGSAFAINALIEADRIALIAGAVAGFVVPTDSGRPHEVFHCTQCSSSVWSTYGGVDALRFLRVGTLDQPSALKPDVHIFTRSKVPWVTLPEGVPAFEVYYDSKTLWPAESLARRRAVMPAR
jgi:hypothetical protein